MMENENSESKSISLEDFDPESIDVWNACKAYSYDFVMLSEAEKCAMGEEARRWLNAWGNALPQFEASRK